MKKILLIIVMLACIAGYGQTGATSGRGGGTTGTWQFVTLDQTTGTTDKTHQMSYAAKNISSAGKGISSMLLCKIYLVSSTGSGGDDDKCKAYQFDIHFPINSLGSNTTTSKD